MAIPITPISGIALPSTPVAGTSGKSGGFQEILAGAVQDVEKAGQTASASIEQFLSGESSELHSTVLATQKAELAFDLFLQMRNKVVSAYQEVMRMQM